uniref:TELO2-interacting protein 1 homolog n=1 Tax=Timema shepardi TaxID=629360 RepID=A0A7R9AR07_TIMSH|nr:unnamed protein product [Timema shepardi]
MGKTAPLVEQEQSVTAPPLDLHEEQGYFGPVPVLPVTETRNKFTPDLLQRVFDPWTSDKKEQLLSSVGNRQLKPVCDDVAHQPSIKNIQNLKDLVQRLPSSTLQHLQEYTLFPMQLQLNNAKLGSEIKVELINGIRHVVEKTEILHLEQLFKLYVFVFLQIFDPSQPSMVASVSEELKLSVVQCATQVLRSTTANVLDQMYQKENVPKLGQGIYICMQLLQTERLKALRLACVDNILVTCQVEDDTNFNDIVFRKQVGDLITLVVPGIIGGLCKVATGDYKVGHRLIQPNSKEGMEILLNSQEQRSPKWLKASARKLLAQTQVIVRVQHSDHWRVRLELVQMCDHVLTHCSWNLSPALLPLLEVVVIGAEDDDDRVATTSKEVLSHLAQSPQLSTTLRENFEQLAALSLVTGYMRLLGSALQDVFTSKVHFEKVVIGLVQVARIETSDVSVLGAPGIIDATTPEGIKVTYFPGPPLCHLSSLLTPVFSPQQLFPYLPHCLCFSRPISPINPVGYHLRPLTFPLQPYTFSPIFTLYANIENQNFAVETHSWKKFCHFTGSSVLAKLEEVCRLLGQLADLDSLVHYLLNLLCEGSEYSKEVIFVLNLVLAAGLCAKDTSALLLVRIVLDAYIDPDFWQLPTSVSTEVTLSQAQSNIVQSCLLVEGVGKVCEALGSVTSKLLLKVLYLVLERCGSPHPLLAAAGGEAARRIACSCGHTDIAALVGNNQDYISFHISMRLRTLELNPGVLDVLNVVLNHSNMELLPHLQRIITEVLLVNFNLRSGRNTTAFLRVFYASICALRRWYHTPDGHTSSPKDNASCSGHPSVVEGLLEYHRCQDSQVTSTYDHEMSQDPNVAPVEESVDLGEDEPMKEPDPTHIVLAANILKSVLHFLPSHDRNLQLLVISILTEGVQVLAACQDQLLPIVHLVWSPLVGRFNQGSDPLIVKRSFELLRVLAQLARDFIRTRTLSVVLPSLCKFLIETAPTSRKKDIGSAYRFTQVYKLQRELLDGLGEVATHLDLAEKELDNVLETVFPYLSNQQPQPLQEGCIKLLKQLAKLDADVVWLKLVNFLPGDKTSIIDEFQNNRELVIQFLDSSCNCAG